MERSICLALICLGTLGYSLAMNSWELPATDALWEHADRALDDAWYTFKRSFNRTYLDKKEDMMRRLYWEDNWRRIRAHNAQYEKGVRSYYLGETVFVDMAEDEFLNMYKNQLKVPLLKHTGVRQPRALNYTLPKTVDWRAKGIVTPVKYQGKCGSCWAFAAVGSLESMVAKKTGKHDQNFSEQNLVDCSGASYGNNGCRGGWMKNAYKYIKDAGGIDTEACYPYTGKIGKCTFRKTCVGANVKTHVSVERKRDALAESVAKVGPIAVSVDVLSMDFALYKGGLWEHKTCDPFNPDHAFVVVGFGVTDKGKKFWTMKNSWGEIWGDKGYVYAEKDTGHDCGIPLFATYPIV